MNPRSPAPPRRNIAVVGSSWGGLHALGRLVAGLEADTRMTVAVVQHRAADAPDQMLVRYMQARSALPVAEAEDKDKIVPGHIYVAPPDYHLLVEPGHLSLSVDAPVLFSRPSVDVLFESAADAYGPGVIAIVLTGANDDGSRGARAVAAAGGMVLAQDPATAERREMPEAAIATGVVDRILSIEDITGVLNTAGREA